MSSGASKIFFDVIQDVDTGQVEAVRVPLGSIESSGRLLCDRLSAVISRLGVSETCLVDDAALLFCRERFADLVGSGAQARPGIPRGTRLFLYRQ